MEERIRHRHAELVAARQAHHAHLAQLRAALATAIQADYGFATAIGELERLLPDLTTPAPEGNTHGVPS